MDHQISATMMLRRQRYGQGTRSVTPPPPVITKHPRGHMSSPRSSSAVTPVRLAQPPRSAPQSPVPMQQMPPPRSEVAAPTEGVPWYEAEVEQKWMDKVSDNIDDEIEEQLAIVLNTQRPSIAATGGLWWRFMAHQQKRQLLPARSVGEAAVHYLLYRAKEGCGGEGTRWTTNGTYARTLRAHIMINVTPAGFTGRHHLITWINTCDVKAMHEQTQHAVDITDAFIITVLQCQVIASEYKTLAWMISVTSGRHSCLMELGDGAIVINKTEKKVHVDWSTRKTNRRKSLQTSNTFDIPEFLLPYTPRATAWKLHKESLSKVSDFNTALKSFPIAPREAHGGSRIDRGAGTGEELFATSYSFRRHAIQRFIAMFSHLSESEKWNAVISLTGHVDKRMPQHTYEKTAVEQAHHWEMAEYEKVAAEATSVA
jgi:hypothetical protein